MTAFDNWPGADVLLFVFFTGLATAARVYEWRCALRCVREARRGS